MWNNLNTPLHFKFFLLLTYFQHVLSSNVQTQLKLSFFVHSNVYIHFPARSLYTDNRPRK